MDHHDPTLVCRRIQPSDVPAVLALLLRLKPPVAGLVSRGVYEALLSDALRDPRVRLFVARADSRPAGYVITVSDWARYWAGFLRRHPFLGVPILVKRLLRGRGTVQPGDAVADNLPGECSSYLSEADPRRTWRDSAADIAKIVHVGVDDRLRGHGIGTRLYRAIMEDLSTAGVRRLDARIDNGNIASLRLHHGAGWRICRDADGYFATVDLDARRT